MASNPIGNRPQRSRRSLSIQSRSNQQEIEAGRWGIEMTEDDVLKLLAASILWIGVFIVVMTIADMAAAA